MYIIMCKMEDKTWVYDDYFGDEKEAKEMAQTLVRDLSYTEVKEMKRSGRPVFTMETRTIECTVQEVTLYREQGPR